MNIEHIAMYVRDLEAAKEFFVRYFRAHSNDGYYNNNTGFRSYFLSFDDGSRLEIMNKQNISEHDNSLEMLGYSHIAFSVGSKENVDELTKKLKNDGYEIVSGPRTTGDGYYESKIIIFDNNQLEITI